MSTPLTPREDRTLELLVDRADGSLSRQDAAELSALLREHPYLEHAIDFAAAAAAIGMIDRFEAMPAHVARTIEATAMEMMAPLQKLDAARTVPMHPRQASTVPIVPSVPLGASRPPQPFVPERAPSVAPPAPRPLLPRLAPWLLAAACLVFAALAWVLKKPEIVTVAPPAPPAPVSVPTAEPPKPTVTQLREAMLARSDVMKASWTGTKDPAAKGASGDVVWSPSDQKGYMRFRGLAANDPKIAQYQLWIFDKNQSERTPVDGGVFDVDAATGDVIVPIEAKLKVVEPTLFAVTVEKPGGVVVSKRERIVVTAAPKA
jgi:hypothetical protein